MQNNKSTPQIRGEVVGTVYTDRQGQPSLVLGTRAREIPHPGNSSSISLNTTIRKEDIDKLFHHQGTTDGNRLSKEMDLVTHLKNKEYNTCKIAETMQTLWRSLELHPYPTAAEVNLLTMKTGLQFKIITDWFTSTRVSLSLSWDKEKIDRTRHRRKVAGSAWHL